jgi:transcriptional antiterminator NusG
MTDMKWYAVNTYSGYENRAKQLLEERIQSLKMSDRFGEVLIPTENVVEVRQGSKRNMTRKFFPGYIFIQMALDDETWHLVTGTQKVTGFVGGGMTPPPVPAHEMKKITQQVEEGIAAPKTTQTFEEGMTVQVIDGPFVNFNGTVEEVRPEKQKLRVLVSIFGRSTPVELDYEQVEIS